MNDAENIEKKWQRVWQEEHIYKTSMPSKDAPKKYILDMFPYPSGAGLHVGHPRGYTGTDVLARFHRMNGCAVLHPMGWDAFGLPAENYAIKTGTPPAKSTEKNIATFRKQIHSLGFSYDWEKEINTATPEYYRWTQWWFLHLYKRGLAYKKKAPVNWCNSCQTVLANEQVIAGACERCDEQVTQKNLLQWFFRITHFVDDIRSELPKNITRAILLHGFEGSPESNFLPYLQKELEARGIAVSAVKLPNPTAPKATEWMKALSDEHPGQDTLLVGHSLGGTLISRWLSATQQKVGKVVVVGAPTRVGGGHEACDDIKKLPLKKDLGFLADVEAWYSTDDPLVEKEDAKELADAFGVPLTIKKNRQHFQEKEPKDLLEAATTRLTRGLLNGLQKIDWPESTMLSQKNWIGKSAGADITFQLEDEESLTVFTTRPDTFFGVTFIALAPEHETVKKAAEKNPEVKKYVEESAAKTERDRQMTKEKTGVPLGISAVNPFTKESIPVYVADFVLGSYGKGALAGVPAHDERDFDFAKKMNLQIKRVVAETETEKDAPLFEAFTGHGVMVNSDFLNGLATHEAIDAAIAHAEEKQFGARTHTLRLRDWLISRQRGWGAPIPIIFNEKGEDYAVDENHLPVEIPDDVNWSTRGKSPLEDSSSFHAGLPTGHRREADTMDTFVCSSWYFFRFADPKNSSAFADEKAINSWLPVDTYIGGAEHTVLHLLYARFFCKVLHHCGMTHVDEPFKQLRHQGIILGENGEKMSKSKGNVVNPDEVIEKVGADSLRLFELFIGPFADSAPWSTEGVQGLRRFLDKCLRLKEHMVQESDSNVKKVVAKTIEKVTNDIPLLKGNTAIAALMSCVNTCSQKGLSKKELEVVALLLAPFAPHTAEEIWREHCRNSTSVHISPWPKENSSLLEESEVSVAIQINGKKRAILKTNKKDTPEAMLENAKKLPEVQKYIEGKEIVKELAIPGKIVTLVVK